MNIWDLVDGRLMENMDKGLTVPKWVLINCSKIPQMPQNLSAQIVCPSPKSLGFSPQSVVCIISFYLSMRFIFDMVKIRSSNLLDCFIIRKIGGKHTLKLYVCILIELEVLNLEKLLNHATFYLAFMIEIIAYKNSHGHIFSQLHDLDFDGQNLINNSKWQLDVKRKKNLFVLSCIKNALM